MSRTRVRRRRVVSVVMLAAAVHLWAARAVLDTDGASQQAAGRTYVVRPGDTLWGIAVRLAPDDDPRPVVEALAAANGVRDGAVVPGQLIRLPDPG